jgi:hypothetical protein
MLVTMLVTTCGSVARDRQKMFGAARLKFLNARDGKVSLVKASEQRHVRFRSLARERRCWEILANQVSRTSRAVNE